MSRLFWNTIGFLLFIGGSMALVYVIGDFIENARGVING